MLLAKLVEVGVGLEKWEVGWSEVVVMAAELMGVAAPCLQRQ